MCSLINCNDKIRTFIDSLNDSERLELYSAVTSDEFVLNVLPEMKKQNPDVKINPFKEENAQLFNNVRKEFNSPITIISIETFLKNEVAEEVSELMNTCNTLG